MRSTAERGVKAAEAVVRYTSFLVWGPVLTLALPLGAVLALPGKHWSAALVPAALVTIVSGLQLALIAGSTRRQIVRLTFWVFAYVFLGFVPLLQIAAARFPWQGTYGQLDLFRAEGIALLGLAGFEGGWMIASSRTRFVTPRFLQRPLRSWPTALLGVAALILIVVALPSLGGLGHVFSSRVEFNRFLVSHYASPKIELLRTLSSTPVFVAGVSTLALWYDRSRRWTVMSRLAWATLAFVLFAASLTMNNPLATARFKFGTVVLAFLFVLPWRRLSAALLMPFMIGIMIIVFPLAGLYRSTLDVNVAAGVAAASTVTRFTQSGDYDAFQQILNTASVVDLHGLQGIKQIGGAFLFFVPRSFWPGKPTPTGSYVASELGYPYTNLSEPLWGELYISGGYLAVLLGFLAYGYVVGLLDRVGEIRKEKAGIGVGTVIVAIYGGYQLYLLRGALMPSLAYLVPMLLLAFVTALPSPSGRNLRQRRVQQSSRTKRWS